MVNSESQYFVPTEQARGKIRSRLRQTAQSVQENKTAMRQAGKERNWETYEQLEDEDSRLFRRRVLLMRTEMRRDWIEFKRNASMVPIAFLDILRAIAGKEAKLSSKSE